MMQSCKREGYVGGNRGKSRINGFNASLLKSVGDIRFFDQTFFSKESLLAAILVISVFVMFTAVAGAATPISGPTTISSPGYYYLTQDITNSSVGIKMDTSDVILDGQGHTIDGIDNSGTGVGVFNQIPNQYNYYPLNNVTVKNLIVTDWNIGIYYKRATNGQILNNTANNNRDGIRLDYYSRSNSIRNNTANNNTKHPDWNLYGIGIEIWEMSNYNEVINNTVNYNDVSGIHLGFEDYIYNRGYAAYNTLENNTANFNHNGIYIEAGLSNTISNNTANNNSNGIGIQQYLNYYSNYNEILDNTFESNTRGILISQNVGYTVVEGNTVNFNGYGIQLSQNSNNQIYSNYVNSSTTHGIYLTSTSNNNIYNNYFDNTNNAYDTGNDIWNTTKQAGPNIFGGPFLGGNYWSDYTGKDTTDYDGLGDTELPYNSSGAILHGGDYLPLAPVPPMPTVIKPNGAEEIPGGSVYDIKWNVSVGTYSLGMNPITIYNSTNNGSDWTQIATNEPNDGRYSWTVPNTFTSSNCLVKVEAIDEHGCAGNDTSDSVFTITRTNSSESETIPAGETETVEGPPESGTTVNVTATGEVTVTVAYYDSDPHPGVPKPAEMLDKYIDVAVSDKDNVTWPMYVKMNYTDDEIPAGVDESTLGLYYYKEGAWHRCSDTGVNVDENYVWANLQDYEYTGVPLNPGGSAQPIAVPDFSRTGLVVGIGMLGIVLAVSVFRRRI